MSFKSFEYSKHLKALSLAALSLTLLWACAPDSDQQNDTQASPVAEVSHEPSKPAVQIEGAARVSYLDGAAKLTKTGVPTELQLGQIVAPGDHLQTGSKTRLEMSFADGSKLRVGPAADVHFAHQSPDQSALFKVAKGEIWGNVRPGKRKLVFQGKHSTATVLGTVYTLKVQEQDTCTRVVKGRVGVHLPSAQSPEHTLQQAPERLTGEQLKGLKDGDMVVPENQWLRLEANQCIVVKDKGKAHVMKFSLDELAKEEAWLKWNQQRDAELPPH